MITKENRYGQYTPCIKHKGHYENTNCPDTIMSTCSCGNPILYPTHKYQTYRNKLLSMFTSPPRVFDIMCPTCYNNIPQSERLIHDKNRKKISL